MFRFSIDRGTGLPVFSVPVALRLFAAPVSDLRCAAPAADTQSFPGGTFTDVYAECPDGSTRVLKLLSVDPAYADAPTEGIRRVLEEVQPACLPACLFVCPPQRAVPSQSLICQLAGTTLLRPCRGAQTLSRPFPAGEPIDTSPIHSIRMGTTVATNALLERNGEPIALVITRGFRDLLRIGNQARPRLFDLTMASPGVLYDHVRFLSATRLQPPWPGITGRPASCASSSSLGGRVQVIEVEGRLLLSPQGTLRGVTGEMVEERTPLEYVGWVETRQSVDNCSAMH